MLFRSPDRRAGCCSSPAANMKDPMTNVRKPTARSRPLTDDARWRTFMRVLRWNSVMTPRYGSVNATNSGTWFGARVSTVSAMYCLPSVMYVIGVPTGAPGKSTDATSLPVALS